MPNYSKTQDPRFWLRWRSAGAVGTIETARISGEVILPGRSAMLRRLLAVDSNAHVQERFFPLLLPHAGTPKVAQGIVLMLVLAIHDYTQGMPPMMQSLFLLKIDSYIDALAGDNKEVAKQAKLHVHNALGINARKAEAKQAEAKPAKDARNSEGITDDKRKVMEAARKIADMIFEYATTDPGSRSEKPWMGDRRNEGVNPFYSQSKSGLFLEFYYGHPSSLWTPWGKWGFSGSASGSWDKFIPEILQRLSATVHQEEFSNTNGTYGPVYAIHALDGEPLPEPVVCPRTEFLEYEIANKEWEELTEAVVS